MRYVKFFRYLIPFWKMEIGILLLSCIVTALGLVNPYLTKLIIDKAYGNRDMGLFIKLVALVAIIFVLSTLFGGLNGYLTRYVNLRLNFNLKHSFFKKLQKLSYRFFQDTSSGDNLYKINSDLEQISQFIVNALPQTIYLVPKLIVIFIIIFHLDWKTALLALVLAPFLYISPLYFKHRLTEFYRISLKNSQGIFKRVHDMLLHMRLVKASGKGQDEIRRYITNLIQNFRFNLRKTRLEMSSSFVNNLIMRVVLGLIIFYGGYRVTKGQMTLGDLSAITIYLNQFTGLHGSLIQFFQQVSFGRVSCERLNAILEARPEFSENAYAKNIIFSKGNIEFRNVTFGYEPGKLVLMDLGFCIPGGSCAALVGPSGCGKTTIVNLITRLYNLDKGEIFIDGRNIRDVKSKSLYAQIGVAMQEPNLWDDTIENNIKYGKGDAVFDEIADAARIACIDSFINSLPKRYNTVIGENACKISEGQKQRIAIARALIKRPKVLILDEAMSAIDSETEDKIIDNIKKEFKGSTIIIISHCLATVKNMNSVYFLISPSFIEIGMHEELVKQSFKYNELFASQITTGRIEEAISI